MPERTVLIYADWKAWPTWTVTDSGSVDNPSPSDLGLSDELSADLVAWADEYDAIFDEDYPPDTAFPSEEAERSWIARGHELARRAAAELGPATEVRYRSGGEHLAV
ncbi:hypothetical protein [Nocardioides panacisoli]|uniref:Uncharacterized protein n=1 Tax=Nocardioides panacisoli TaxID=627624 RepID=A0ABP7J216_9ACTN